MILSENLTIKFEKSKSVEKRGQIYWKLIFGIGRSSVTVKNEKSNGQ